MKNTLIYTLLLNSKIRKILIIKTILHFDVLLLIKNIQKFL